MPGKGKGRISDGDGSFYRGSDPQFSTAAAGLFSEPPSRVPASQSTAGPAAEYSAPPPRMTAKHSLDLDPQGAVSDPKRARIDGSAGAAAAVDDDTALHVKMTNLSTEIAQDGAKLLNQYITEALEGKHHAKGVTKEGRAMAGLFEINYERGKVLRRSEIDPNSGDYHKFKGILPVGGTIGIIEGMTRVTGSFLKSILDFHDAARENTEGECKSAHEKAWKSANYAHGVWRNMNHNKKDLTEGLGDRPKISDPFALSKGYMSIFMHSAPPPRIPASQSTAGPAARHTAPPPRIPAPPQSAGAAAAAVDSKALSRKEEMTNFSTKVAQDGIILLNKYIDEALNKKHSHKDDTEEGREMVNLLRSNYEGSGNRERFRIEYRYCDDYNKFLDILPIGDAVRITTGAQAVRISNLKDISSFHSKAFKNTEGKCKEAHIEAWNIARYAQGVWRNMRDEKGDLTEGLGDRPKISGPPLLSQGYLDATGLEYRHSAPPPRIPTSQSTAGPAAGNRAASAKQVVTKGIFIDVMNKFKGGIAGMYVRKDAVADLKSAMGEVLAESRRELAAIKQDRESAKQDREDAKQDREDAKQDREAAKQDREDSAKELADIIEMRKISQKLNKEQEDLNKALEERLFQLDGILPGKVKKTEPGMASSEAGAAAAAHVYEEPKPTVVKVEPGAAAQLSDKYIKKESQYH